MKRRAKEILMAVTGKNDYLLSARTVSFSDLARGSAIFVTIRGWDNGPMFVDDLKRLAKESGFIFQFE